MYYHHIAPVRNTVYLYASFVFFLLLHTLSILLEKLTSKLVTHATHPATIIISVLYREEKMNKFLKTCIIKCWILCTFFYWKILALQCTGFCHTSAWITHRCPRVPLTFASLSPPHPTSCTEHGRGALSTRADVCLPAALSSSHTAHKPVL